MIILREEFNKMTISFYIKKKKGFLYSPKINFFNLKSKI